MGDVYLLNVNPGTVSAHFAESLADSAHLFKDRFYETSNVNICHARNRLVGKFLTASQHDDYALLVDSDIVFTPEDVTTLIDADKPIISGLYKVPNRGITLITDEAGNLDYSYPPDSVVKGGVTGLGFVLVHCDVFAAIQTAYGLYGCFQEQVVNETWVAEDVNFYRRAKKLGIPLWMHTGVNVGHHKGRTIHYP